MLDEIIGLIVEQDKDNYLTQPTMTNMRLDNIELSLSELSETLKAMQEIIKVNGSSWISKKKNKKDGKEEITGGIKSEPHVRNAIDYILNPSKSAYSAFINCHNGTGYDVAIQFKNIRELFNKNDKILAHHYVQSFAPDDNVTPEQAFEIGKRLAEKMAPGFQIVVSTHIDKDCIHNHIIINSVNPITGLKYTADNTSLAFARAESDKLCREYNLSVIKKIKRIDLKVLIWLHTSLVLKEKLEDKAYVRFRWSFKML